MNNTAPQPITRYDPDKLAQALSSFAGVVEKAETLDEVKRAGHQLKQNVKQSRIKA